MTENLDILQPFLIKFPEEVLQEDKEKNKDRDPGSKKLQIQPNISVTEVPRDNAMVHISHEF
jgi:hypothetical protein